MEKSNTTLKNFSALAGKYNTGKYLGRDGWSKLAYEVRSRFECQGLPGAIVNYKQDHGGGRGRPRPRRQR